MSTNSYDVAIIGGGPSGSTTGTMLKKYNPDLKVLILEREKFPRDHIGESQLPIVSYVLDEMGVWDKVEQANFPIKVGATYRWGKTADLWDFEFIPPAEFKDEPRPAKYEGLRKKTAFQVDRAIYDEILLNHAREMGCEAREESKVAQVKVSGDRIEGLVLGDGSTVEARHYVDCSGASAILRRALNVPVDEVSTLKNIAIWEYWQNADWAVEIGVGGTRIQVMSLGYGWIWFIPLGPTRTSVGLVLPADYYKRTGKRPEELYETALQEEPRISALLRNATRENKMGTTKDWSFMSERMAGENWFLVGESAGFADPILSAGLTLAHVGAKECAYTILELDREEQNPLWLREQYEARQKRRIYQHIRFADYWYAANAHFSDLKEFTREIARDAGLELDADAAWQWLGTGGFVDDEVGGAGLGAFSVAAVRKLLNEFSEKPSDWMISRNNIFKLNLSGAKQSAIAIYAKGRVLKTSAYIRDGKVLPTMLAFRFFVESLQRVNRIDQLLPMIDDIWCSQPGNTPRDWLNLAVQALEAMVSDGWVEASYNPALPLADFGSFGDGRLIHPNQDAAVG